MRRSVLLIAGASLAVAGIILLEYFSVRITSIPEDRFSGGGGGGYINTFYPQNSLAFQIPPPRFSGASSGGYSYDTWLHSGLVLIQPPIRFSGGLMDGSAFTILFELTNGLAAPPLRFSGGSSDGYSRGVWLTIILDGFQSVLRFSGGGSDGYAQFLRFGISSSGVQSISRFFGGGYGGYVYRSIIGSSCASFYPAMRFWGGGMDGSSVFLFLTSGSYLGQFSPRYYGGSFDGAEVVAIRFPITSIAPDSNNDGLPDWWVIRWYTNLASIVSTNDTDVDGADALAEYIAGTDPLKASSVFRIGAAAQSGSVIELSFPCLASRVYSMQYVNDLITGVWSNVIGQTRIQGSISGVMSMPVPVTSNSCMMRVIVEFP
jgi:hypothetical protein